MISAKRYYLCKKSGCIFYMNKNKHSLYNASLSSFNLKKQEDLDQLAILSHYLQNFNLIDNEHLETSGKDILRNRFDFHNLDDIMDSSLMRNLFDDVMNVPFPPTDNSQFTFIDLFAGMGGFRLAMQSLGGRCTFSSEWNSFAQKTYFANFGEMPFGDITKQETKQYIPRQFDVLCAGFPCQPFSIAGVSKKNSLGRAHGFKDEAQGTLFFDVAEIIEKHQPKAFFLENVKNLVSHDKGNTFRVISNTLRELGYTIHYQVMNGKYLVPQNRERIFIVGFRKDLFGDTTSFEFPDIEGELPKLKTILDPEVDAKYTLTDKLWEYLQNYAAKHKAAGNGFGFGMADPEGISRTLSARYYKDGSEILIPQTGLDGEMINPRRLTPKECTRLMGYPEQYIINAVSDLQGYRQCGNSVVVPLIKAVATNLVQTLLNEEH